MIDTGVCRDRGDDPRPKAAGTEADLTGGFPCVDCPADYYHAGIFGGAPRLLTPCGDSSTGASHDSDTTVYSATGICGWQGMHDGAARGVRGKDGR